MISAWKRLKRGKERIAVLSRAAGEGFAKPDGAERGPGGSVFSQVDPGKVVRSTPAGSPAGRGEQGDGQGGWWWCWGGGPPPTRSSEAFSLPAEGAVPRASRGDRTVCLPRAGAQRNEACFKDLSPVTREIRAQGNSTEGGGKWEDSGSVLKKTLGIGNGVEIKRGVEGHPSFHRAPPRVRPPLRRRRGHGQRRFGPGRGPVVTPESSVSGISGLKGS